MSIRLLLQYVAEPSNSSSLQSIGIVTWIGLTNGEPAGGYPHQDIIYVTVIIGLGLLGALLLMFFWFVGIYLIGSTYFFKLLCIGIRRLVLNGQSITDRNPS
jgi:hypothetical protein